MIVAITLVFVAGCGSGGPGPRPAISALPSTQVAGRTAGDSRPLLSAATPTASANATATASPTPSPTTTPATATTTSQPALSLTPNEHVDALALGGGTAVRSQPSMHEGQTVRTLHDQESIVLLREVRGERFVVGNQTWPMAIQDWTNLWYLIDGGYVYSGFVFIPRPGELDTLADRTAARIVDVDLNRQTATAMIGDRAVHVAPATTGKPGFETPAGQHAIGAWGRKLSETMTSSQAGIQNPAEQYNVQNVLYTQYFDGAGDALHLNYWQPDSVFGSARTSHGCVGLELHDAQFFWLFADAGARVMIHPVPATVSPTPSATPAASATPVATAATAIAAPSSTASVATATHPVAATPAPPTATPARSVSRGAAGPSLAAPAVPVTRVPLTPRAIASPIPPVPATTQ